jgi:hypothetical protein
VALHLPTGPAGTAAAAKRNCARVLAETERSIRADYDKYLTTPEAFVYL